MSRLSKGIVGVVVITLVFCGGYLYGQYSYQPQDEQLKQYRDMVNNASMISRYSMLADMQRLHGTKEDYRDALLLLDEVSDKVNYENDPLLDKNIYYIDKALTNMRLSKVECELGDADISKYYFAKALDACSHVNKSWCSPEELPLVVERLEKDNSNKALQQNAATPRC
jgi:hypothetical protein